MKKTFILFICLLAGASLVAQEKYPVNNLTSDQKHGRAVSQAWVLSAAGINFAKSHGVSPYEYGKYLGKLFAPSWGPGNDFETFVRGSIYNFESFRHVTDTPLQVEENSDGSVIIITSDEMWHKYFPDGGFIPYAEFLEFVRGLNEPIAEHMGASMTSERKDGLMIFTYRRK